MKNLNIVLAATLSLFGSLFAYSETLEELVAAKKASNPSAYEELRHNSRLAARWVNQHSIPVTSTNTLARHPAVVAQEQAMKDAAIAGARQLGTPLSTDEEIWTALTSLSGAQFIIRAEQLVEAGGTNTFERVKRGEAAQKISALFLAAKEYAGTTPVPGTSTAVAGFRDAWFAQSNRTVVVTQRVPWIQLYRDPPGTPVTPEEIKALLNPRGPRHAPR